MVGGAGYIGSVLARRLLAGGYTVRVLDSLVFGSESLHDLRAHPRFRLVAGDLRHPALVADALCGAAAVVHLAAIVGDPACAVDETAALEINLSGTRLLAEAARAAGVSRFVFASTCSVYGAASDLVDEFCPPHPLSLYAATKLEAERRLLASRSRTFHPVVLRLATAFGWSWRPRFDLVVNLLAARAAAERRIQIFNGAQWRPFVHVRDIARAVLLALEAPDAWVSGEVFNVGSTSLNLTLKELAAQIIRLQPDLHVEYTPAPDARDYRVSFEKIRRLGFRRRWNLTAGIREVRRAVTGGFDWRNPRYHNLEHTLVRRGLAEPSTWRAEAGEPGEPASARMRISYPQATWS